MVKDEIAHDEQFLLWAQCFQLYLTIKLSFMEIFLGFCHNVFKVVCCRFVVLERVNDLNLMPDTIFLESSALKAFNPVKLQTHF